MSIQNLFFSNYFYDRDRLGSTTLGIMTLDLMALITVTLGIMSLSVPDLVVMFSIRELHNGIFYISFLFK